MVVSSHPALCDACALVVHLRLSLWPRLSSRHHDSLRVLRRLHRIHHVPHATPATLSAPHVTIENMKVSLSGTTILASGIGHVPPALPEGIDTIAPNRVLQDTLIFDGQPDVLIPTGALKQRQWRRGRRAACTPRPSTLTRQGACPAERLARRDDRANRTAARLGRVRDHDAQRLSAVRGRAA